MSRSLQNIRNKVNTQLWDTLYNIYPIPQAATRKQLKVNTAPLFQLCGEGGDEKEKYFLFPNVFDFWFYKSWCYNMGGGVAVANTDEEFHSQMDVAEALVDPQTHEKCMHARCWQ